jgi:hypothetical protein
MLMQLIARTFVAISIGLGSATLAAADSGVPRRAVQDFRELMVEAIDAPDGKAQGQLVGEMVQALSAGLKTNAPVLVDVRTERRYAQEGCRRLVVTFSQDGVHLPGFDKPQQRSMDMGINYCRDGKPPRALR